jgi:HEPN domain-containing protein
MSEDNLVPEWFNFALDDLECARVLLRERRLRNVCYLCQQAAEKSLLQQYPHSVPLNEYAAETRYPDDYVAVSPAEAEAAVGHAQAIYDFCKAKCFPDKI